MSVFDSIVRATLPITPKPMIHFFARRYVAGATLTDAIATVKRLSEEGCCATLDVLGESVSERQHAATAVAEYHRRSLSENPSFPRISKSAVDWPPLPGSRSRMPTRASPATSSIPLPPLARKFVCCLS